jgi:hypothetical protein
MLKNTYNKKLFNCLTIILIILVTFLEHNQVYISNVKSKFNNCLSSDRSLFVDESICCKSFKNSTDPLTFLP